ncbi:ComF family protein [Blastococcus sp. SYSU DS0753]
MSLYMKPSLLRDWLTQYKGRLADEDEPYVPEYAAFVRALLGRFLIERGGDLVSVFGLVDGIVVVPSTDRPPPHPLADVLTSLNLDTPVLDILRRGPGPLGFRRPHPEAYEVRAAVALPRRVLLVDDVYTTGSRVNSAAYALRANGVEVAGFLAIARRVNPAWKPEVGAFWDRQKALAYDWSQIPV